MKTEISQAYEELNKSGRLESLYDYQQISVQKPKKNVLSKTKKRKIKREKKKNANLGN